jgi:hypothetical protein
MFGLTILIIGIGTLLSYRKTYDDGTGWYRKIVNAIQWIVMIVCGIILLAAIGHFSLPEFEAWLSS